jgi:hypothetical protein
MIENKRGYTIRDRRGEAKGAARGPTRRGPQASWGFYPTPRYAGWDNYRPRPFMAQTAGKGGLPPFDRWEIMNYGKQLFSQLGHVAAAVKQKNSWAVGEAWDPVFCGSPAGEAWGKEVAQWLREVWYPQCNVRGEPFDFKTGLYLSGLAWDVDGDDLMVLTGTESGFPLISIVPCQRIGGVSRADSVVTGGPYDGARIYDGVIYDRNARPLAFRVANDTLAGSGLESLETAGNGDEGYRDIPAYNCQLMFEPEWSDQGRGISRFGRPILDVMDAQDIDVFLKKGVKMDASQGIMHYTESGEAEDESTSILAQDITIGGAPTGDTRMDEVVPNRQYQITPVAGGEYMFFRANSGEKLEVMESERPSQNTEAFIKRLERRIMLALDWSYDLLDLTAISGAPSRLLKDLAMRSIQDRQRNLKRRALRAVRYAVCKAMKRGLIPKYYGKDGDGDFLKWDFEMPGEISIDTGNDRAADREDLKLGVTTLAKLCAKNGLGDWRNLQAQSRKEILGWAQEAEAIEKATKGKITFEKAFELLSQRTPNGTPMSQMGDLPGDGEDKAEEPPKTKTA